MIRMISAILLAIICFNLHVCADGLAIGKGDMVSNGNMADSEFQQQPVPMQYPVYAAPEDENGSSFENAFALFKYLYLNPRRVMVSRARDEMQRKRSSIWKQCAFNAVSCFGKK